MQVFPIVDLRLIGGVVLVTSSIKERKTIYLVEFAGKIWSMCNSLPIVNLLGTLYPNQLYIRSNMQVHSCMVRVMVSFMLIYCEIYIIGNDR